VTTCGKEDTPSLDNVNMQHWGSSDEMNLDCIGLESTQFYTAQIVSNHSKSTCRQGVANLVLVPNTIEKVDLFFTHAGGLKLLIGVVKAVGLLS
jgi:hypothetical protein